MTNRRRSGPLPSRAHPLSVWARWFAAGGVLLGLALAYVWFPEFRVSIERLTSPMARGDFRALKEFILSFGWWAPAVSALLMILQTLIAPLPAFVLAMANAMAFGVLYGFLLTCFSAMLAAFTAFYLARWLGRPFVERWTRGRALDAFIERYGAWGVLVLRLFPVVSFDFVSFAAGLTAMRARSFGLATLLGMLPASIAYSLLGESIESANRWSLIGGAVLLAILLVIAAVVRRTSAWRSLKPDVAVSSDEANKFCQVKEEVL